MSISTGLRFQQRLIDHSCGASAGSNPVHLQAARDLAQVLHENNAQLIYGGGTAGVMGELAKTLVSLSGPDAVHGIIPRPLLEFERKQDEHGNETDPEKIVDKAVFGRTTVVKSMHERKAMMKNEVASGGPGSGFVSLSGGLGTFEELLEMSTWNQLNIHALPVVVFNILGLYDGILQSIEKAVELGFIREGNRAIIIEAKTAKDVWIQLRDYQLAQGRLNISWNEEEQ